MRYICIQNHGQTWFLDNTGSWSASRDKALTFKTSMEAIAYIGVRGLFDHRLCVCDDRGGKQDAGNVKTP